MAERPGFYLPDFCRAQSVLAVILIAALVALLLTLARQGISPGFWTELAQISLFLSVGRARHGGPLVRGARPPVAARRARGIRRRARARTRRHGNRDRRRLVARGLREPHAWHRGCAGESAPTCRCCFGNLAVCAIAGGIALRYFYVAHQWQSNVEAEAQSRVRALQARIRPHFLFNSMNTIASLTRTNPRGAEQAIADLSDLFRASLREHRERIPLAQRDRDRARLRARRAAPARRQAAGGLADRRAAARGDRACADPAAAARKRRLPRHRAARQRRHHPRLRQARGRERRHHDRQPGLVPASSGAVLATASGSTTSASASSSCSTAKAKSRSSRRRTGSW